MVRGRAAQRKAVFATFVVFWAVVGVLAWLGVPLGLELIGVLAVLAFGTGHVVWRRAQRRR